MWTRVAGVTNDGRIIADEFNRNPELSIALFGKKYQDWTFIDVHARNLRPEFGDTKEDIREQVESFLMEIHGSFIRAKVVVDANN
jgi:hypothetical protein